MIYKDSPKILLWDIETAPMLSWHWGLWQQDINRNHVEQPWFIICASWQWWGQKRVYSSSVLDDPEAFKKDPTNDFVVVDALRNAIEDAAILVHHNGDKFDLKRLKTRMALYKMEQLKKVKTVDTLKQVKKHFDFPSNKLDNLVKEFGYEGKAHITMQDFIQCAKGHVPSIRKMLKYNRQDIHTQRDLLEEIFDYIDLPNVSLYVDDDEPMCPKCGSKNLIKKGYEVAYASTYQAYQCKEHGHRSRGKTAIRGVNYR